MFTSLKYNIRDVKDRTVYMELFSDKKIAYRVTAGRTSKFGEEIATYGIEASDSITGEYEKIPDFSPDIKDAVAFAEMLTSNKVKPKNLYGMALCYLMLSI